MLSTNVSTIWNAVAVDPNGEIIVYASANQLIVSDYEKGLFSLHWSEKPARINFVNWMEAGPQNKHWASIALGCDDGNIVIWNCEWNVFDPEDWSF